MARRKVTEEEHELLARAMRAVKPFANARVKGAPPAKAAANPLAAAKPGAAKVVPANAPNPSREALRARPGKAPDLRAIDRRTDQKLKRGQVPVDATLDLHGLSQARAHRRLNSFLAKAAAEGSRTVLVITGKGRAEPGEEGAVPSERRGVLREAVPRWIEQAPLREMVWGIRPAGPRQGGQGALYVLLKRPKSSI
jgi:DNA-nicking Smr family endonuclease